MYIPNTSQPSTIFWNKSSCDTKRKHIYHCVERLIVDQYFFAKCKQIGIFLFSEINLLKVALLDKNYCKHAVHMKQIITHH